MGAERRALARGRRAGAERSAERAWVRSSLATRTRACRGRAAAASRRAGGRFAASAAGAAARAAAAGGRLSMLQAMPINAPRAQAVSASTADIWPALSVRDLRRGLAGAGSGANRRESGLSSSERLIIAGTGAEAGSGRDLGGRSSWVDSGGATWLRHERNKPLRLRERASRARLEDDQRLHAEPDQQRGGQPQLRVRQDARTIDAPAAVTRGRRGATGRRHGVPAPVTVVPESALHGASATRERPGDGSSRRSQAIGRMRGRAQGGHDRLERGGK